MAAKKKASKFRWQENYASFLLGAVIVVILGLLVANFIMNRAGEVGDGDQISQTEESANEISQGREYTIKENDSLSKIAEEVYGSTEMWPALARANDISNPNMIFQGATLKVPAENEAQQISEDMIKTSYEVKEGDTLFAIAEKVYGNGSQWTTIAKANNVGRLPNGNPLIFAGSTLVIPR